MSHDCDATSAPALDQLAFDARAVLMREPRALLDPRQLGPLHSDFEAELGAEKAAEALIQIGFLHGLQDARRVLAGVDRNRRGETGLPANPPLTIRCKVEPGAESPGALRVAGTWPQRNEASARLATGGPCVETGCYVSEGYTSGWLSGMLDADMLALETTCSANGEEACRFLAREAACWRSADDPRALRLLDALPFEALRRLVGSEELPEPTPAAGQESAVVHIWGPVMVVPFTGPDEALKAMQLLGNDPAAAEVSVVVLDLCGATLGGAPETVALEELVVRAESFGAEVVFAAASPLAEPGIASLERPPLAVHRELDQAIAAAFQIAEAQRRLV